MAECLLCGSSDNTVVFDLGMQPSARHWPLPGDPLPDAAHALAMRLCRACGLAQLDADDTTEPEVVVPEPQAVTDQARQAVADLARLGHLDGRRTVVEFGSPHGGSWLPFLDLEPVSGPADLLVDSLGLMHDRDLRAALERRAAALADGGLAVFLIQPLGDVVEQRQWTALRHGHHAYFSLTSLRGALELAGLAPVTALRYDLYGGVAVVLAARGGQPDAGLRAAYDDEARKGLATPGGLAGLADAVTESLGQLRDYLADRQATGTRLFAYGAASKAVAELAMVGEVAGAILAVGDASPNKQGRCMPGSRVPVVSPEELIEAGPEEVLLLLADLQDEVLAAYPQLRGRLVAAGPGGIARPSRRIDAWPGSVAAQARLHEVVPGGAHTYARGPDQYPESAPVVIVRGRGAQVWDVDNHSYVEYGIGLRAVTLGHRHPRVDEAVRRAQRDGISFSRPTLLEAKTAERFLANVPGAERVKFAKNGSDVTTAAVKLARAATGRWRIAVADQSFFSVDEWWIGHTALNAGTLPAEVEAGSLFPYGDLGAVRAIVEQGDVAAVMLQAADATTEPDLPFLTGLRELCDRTGTVLVYDEIVTGYRWHTGGIQALTGVSPDLSCWAKGIGNGYAISALTGRADLMDLGGLATGRDRPFLVSTTYGPESVGLAALGAVMDEYAASDPIAAIRSAGERLAAGMTEVTSAAGLSRHLFPAGDPRCLVFTTLDADGNRSQAMRTVLMQGLLRHGVLAQSWVTCAAHSEADIDHTIEAIALSLDDYARALVDGPESVLTGRPVAPSMRPYAAPRQITLTGPKRAGKPGGEGQGSLLSKEAGGNTVFEHAREHTRSREVR